MTKEGQFLQSLKDIFVGAPVEGESGYINLMRVKSTYFEKGVFPQLMQDIEEALEPFPGFREELFDKLHSFFRRYFSESGSIYYRYTPLHERVYEKVYTDDRDVMLFWKTHMLYYVKTDQLFQSMETMVDAFGFFFDVSTLEHKQANEKRALVFDFMEKRDDGVLIFGVTYSQRGRKTNVGDIRRAIKEASGLSRYTDSVPSEETLERAFRLFERQSEVDYFINKDARAFLREQFDLWFYQYVFEPDQRSATVWTEMRLHQLQCFRDIVYNIIDFIAQFEDELVRIWKKPKFVLNSHYVITLDRIASQENGNELLDRICASPSISSQVQEWYDLGMVAEDFVPGQMLRDDGSLRARHQYLPLDTRLFPDLESDLLSSFDDLEDRLDGWLVQSHNYQALNTLMRKFQGQVRLAYIDPPYNTEKDSFSYLDRFNSASWLTMMENSIRIARDWLGDEGSFYAQVDFHETATLKLLLDKIFGKDNLLNEIIWRIGWVSGFKTAGEKFVRNHDTIWAYRKASAAPFHGERLDVPYRTFPLPRESMQAIREAVRQYGLRETNIKVVVRTEDGTVLIPEGRGGEREGTYPLEDVWNASDYDELHSIMIMSFSNEKVGDFLTQKPEKLLSRIIEASTEPKDIVLDFYAGTGTTCATAHKLGRRWVGVELQYGEEKVLPRLKEVLAGQSNREPCGISRDVQWQGGGFFKYFELEQYEQVLRRAHYADAEPLFVQSDPYDQYVFLRDTKLLDNVENAGEVGKVVEVSPGDDEVKVDLSKLYDGIDLAETLSCITGKWIRRLTEEEVEFEDGTRVNLENPDWQLIKPLIWW